MAEEKPANALWPDIERAIRTLAYLMLPRGRRYPQIEEYLDVHEFGLALEELAAEVRDARRG